jgi:hypothetical protein
MPQCLIVVLVLCVALTACGLACVSALARRDDYSRQLRDARTQLDATRADLRRATEQRDRLYWLEWWMKNACETTPLDGSRATLIRYAIAAHLAPDMATLHRDLQRLSEDPKRAEPERTSARAFAVEIELAQRQGVTPWAIFAAQPAMQGRALHNQHVLETSYRAALDGWPRLFDGSG